MFEPKERSGLDGSTHEPRIVSVPILDWNSRWALSARRVSREDMERDRPIGYPRSSQMNRSLHTPIAPRKVIGAWVCLITVLLLWAPMWGSAWQAREMACCTGNICAVHGHAKTQPSRTGGATRHEAAATECEHTKGAGMAACTMSCCHEQSSSVVSSAVYVLPEPAVLALPAKTLNPTDVMSYEEVLQSFAPPSPPPKTSLQ
jgi:hypothetical protein